MSVVCSQCGQKNPDGFAFCGRCGSPLDATGRSARRATYVPARRCWSRGPESSSKRRSVAGGDAGEHPVALVRAVGAAQVRGTGEAAEKTSHEHRTDGDRGSSLGF